MAILPLYNIVASPNGRMTLPPKHAKEIW